MSNASPPPSVDKGSQATAAATTIPAITSIPATATPSISAPGQTPLPASIPSPSASTIPTSLQPAAPSSPSFSFPNLDAYAWKAIASGLTSPVGLAHAGDASKRLFVLEQAGQIRIIQNGAPLIEPYLNIQERVGSDGNEQGLLGLAFHPHYAENGYFFVNYTDRQENTVIARFQVSPDDPNRADPHSEKRLLYIHQPYPNHNGGAIAFGPDGYLYLGLGDGGSGGDPQGNGQSLETLLGKILRIDVDGGEPYAIPPDNPFLGTSRPEIWVYGLRNPWRFAFDRLTGDLFIGDVGQDEWEEIDFLPAGNPGGANFGWNYLEGLHDYAGSPAAGVELIPPVAEYSHSDGCSVTGGVIYRGLQLPEWQGIYLFGDYCSGRVWGLRQNAKGQWIHQALFENAGLITSFGEDEAGEIYLVDRNGSVYQLAEK